MPQTDRGPGTIDPDGPRSARGLWRLSRVPGIDAAKARRIAEAFGDWTALSGADLPALARLGVAGAARHLQAIPEVELPRTVDGRVLSVFDPDYPACLASIPNAPLLLWVEGTLPDLPGVAVVGTRSPTSFGQRVARRAAQEVIAAGRPVISGMAEGVDQIAEAAALEADGIVVSVIGGGLDTVSGHRAGHRNAILAAGGAVVSEQPPGTEASRATLDLRDRIQAGLSASVVIAQAGLHGGTSVTVRFALTQGRRLIVPQPAEGSEHARTPASALLLALTDPGGIDPGLLGLTGRHAAAMANRRPAADVVVHTGEDLARALRSTPSAAADDGF